MHRYLFIFVYTYVNMYLQMSRHDLPQFASHSPPSSLEGLEASLAWRYGARAERDSPLDWGPWLPKLWPQPTPANVPLLRAFWSLLDGIWGSLKGSWRVPISWSHFISKPLGELYPYWLLYLVLMKKLELLIPWWLENRVFKNCGDSIRYLKKASKQHW